MIEPTLFYRKMDALLARIDEEGGTVDFLPVLLRELEDLFGENFHFSHGHLYQEGDEVFVLHESPATGALLPARLPLDADAVQRVILHGSYIFDAADEAPEFGLASTTVPTAIPAAFAVVRGPNRRWLFVYLLETGWSHEEVTFCINAVRFALNFQLQTKAIKDDLDQAERIQESLLPTTPPSFPGYEIACRSQPAEQVSGDLYDFIIPDVGVLGVAVGDASGHGLPAALLVRDVITGLRMGMATQLKILSTLKRLNQVIHRSALSSRFASLFYGEIERNGNLIYANAGHMPPLIVHDGTITELWPTGMIIGPVPDLPLERAFAHLAPGALLVLYSDGITERFDDHRGMFDIDGLKALLLKHQDDAPDVLVERIFSAASAFGNDAAWADDATVVVVKRLAVLAEKA